MVRCGDWDRDNDLEPRPHQDRRVSKISKHPSYNPDTVYNDAAILYVEEDFELDAHIDTICLPVAPYDRSEYLPDSCYATGWGMDRHEGSYQTFLKQVKLPIIPNDVCQQRFRRLTDLGPQFNLHESFLCAGGGKADTCKVKIPIKKYILVEESGQTFEFRAIFSPSRN